MATTTAKKQSDDDDDDTPMQADAGTSSPKELKLAMYAKCAAHDENHIFDQGELLTLGVIPGDDVQHLVTVMRQLAKDGLVKVMAKDGKACWKVVKKDDAKK